MAEPLPDAEAATTEMFQNDGEKGTPHHAPNDPPRRRANQRPSNGTIEHDRSPIWGVVGHESGKFGWRAVLIRSEPPSSPKLKIKLKPLRPSIPPRTRPTSNPPAPVLGMGLYVTQPVSMLVMTPMAGSEKLIATRWKASGPDCATSCGSSAEGTKSS